MDTETVQRKALEDGTVRSNVYEIGDKLFELEEIMKSSEVIPSQVSNKFENMMKAYKAFKNQLDASLEWD